MNSLIPLTIYGIGVYHPKGWKLFINPNTTFNFNEGMVKIDKESAAKTNAASLSIRWATMKNEVKIDDYVNELDLQLQKKQKKSRNKDKYRILRREKHRLNGKDACLIENEFIANHSIYRIFGKDELVKVLQLFFYSKESGRMIVASLSATEEEMKRNKEGYKETLLSLHENINQVQTENVKRTKIEKAM
ncbi:hypothetical protein [Fictibacillus enclensis]|nr:hypothetical protein [Fictibacillus enclensis]